MNIVASCVLVFCFLESCMYVCSKLLHYVDVVENDMQRYNWTGKVYYVTGPTHEIKFSQRFCQLHITVAAMKAYCECIAASTFGRQSTKGASGLTEGAPRPYMKLAYVELQVRPLADGLYCTGFFSPV